MLEKIYSFEIGGDSYKIVFGVNASHTVLEESEKGGYIENFHYEEGNPEKNQRESEYDELEAICLDPLSWESSRPARRIEFDPSVENRFIDYEKESNRVRIRDEKGEIVKIIEEETGKEFEYLDLEQSIYF